MTWKQALTRAIKEEIAAEDAATSAEEVRRQTWWTTTWALAVVPRVEWGQAADQYVNQGGGRRGFTKATANKRRFVGVRLTEVSLDGNLPQSRFAEAVVNWIGKDGDEVKVKEAIKLLAQAERDEVSLREFNQMLTGKPWTNTPENLTEADEDKIATKVARKRPHVVAEAAASGQLSTEGAKSLAAALPSDVIEDEANQRRSTRINENRDNVSREAGMTPEEIADANHMVDVLQGAVNALNDQTTTMAQNWWQKHLIDARGSLASATHSVRNEDLDDAALVFGSEMVVEIKDIVGLLEMIFSRGDLPAKVEEWLKAQAS